MKLTSAQKQEAANQRSAGDDVPVRLVGNFGLYTLAPAFSANSGSGVKLSLVDKVLNI